jgi:hypothetical protein
MKLLIKSNFIIEPSDRLAKNLSNSNEAFDGWLMIKVMGIVREVKYCKFYYNDERSREGRGVVSQATAVACGEEFHFSEK